MTAGFRRAVAKRRAPMLALGAMLCASAVVISNVAIAQVAPVGLGTAGSFAVLAGAAVTNTGPSVVNGDLGVHPGSSVTGFPPGIVNGATHVANAVALQAQNDLTTAFNDAAGRTPFTNLAAELGGRTLTEGVYRVGAAQLTGTLTLDAQGNPDAVFIFQVDSSLTTASASRVALINGAQACNVFWVVGSSATLGTNSTFVGTLMAQASITLTTGATVEGRLLARTGAVTLDTNVITRPLCATTTTVGPTTTVLGPTTTTAPGVTTTTTPGLPGGLPGVLPGGLPGVLPGVLPGGLPGLPGVGPGPGPDGVGPGGTDGFFDDDDGDGFDDDRPPGERGTPPQGDDESDDDSDDARPVGTPDGAPQAAPATTPAPTRAFDLGASFLAPNVQPARKRPTLSLASTA